MDYALSGHVYHHEVYTVLQLFFPNMKYRQTEFAGEGLCLVSVLSGGTISAAVYEDGAELMPPLSYSAEGLSVKQLRHVIKQSVYLCLMMYTDEEMPWGMLTGIRPTKLVRELKKRGLSAPEIVGKLEDDFFVSPAKARLAAETQQNEDKFLTFPQNAVSLYVGIPFCPSRCLYCSFTSYPIGKFAGLCAGYMEALKRELSQIAVIISERGEYLQTLYVGGGTPIAIEAGQIDDMLGHISDKFDLSKLQEFSYEAGRPDAITEEKLRILKRRGVSRLAVNPQTLNDGTLRIIGRNHDSADFFTAYKLARELGFDDINADVILGLPGEKPADTGRTIEGILALAPDSLTVHTLCVKRASDLKERLTEYALATADELSVMGASAYEACKKAGLLPYYLYRQKYAIGNFENVGYARPGAESGYNVRIMEEIENIYAAGAGAVSKFYFPEDDRVERAFNLKNVEDYIARVDEMTERKRAVLAM